VKHRTGFVSKIVRDGESASTGTLAIVGRPNVGKSTLFNRLVGSRRAIVGDEPGITRDRIYGDAEWLGRTIRVVDTGGIIPDDQALIPSEIFRQARVALEEADAIVLVVDGRSELAAPDIDLARLLLRTGKPLLLAVNKIDTPKLAPYAEEFRSLGIRELFPLSAEHGDGVAELLDYALSVMPAEAQAEDAAGTGELPIPFDKPRTSSRRRSAARRALASHGLTEEEASESSELETETDGDEDAEAVTETKVAIIGRPNVGKSTLLNALTGTSRAIVSPVAGTTRDAVDEFVERDGRTYRFIDTAGIRRKGKTDLMAEKLSVIVARKHLEAADVALIVIDATEGVTAGDATIAGYAHESGRSVIIVINKWDTVSAPANDSPDDNQERRPGDSAKRRAVGTHSARLSNREDSKPTADRQVYEEQVRRHLKFLSYAPIVFVSATTGKNLDKLFPILELVAGERRKRISTGEMNRFLNHIDFERASVPMAKRLKIYYMTQAAIAPPTFILFTDRAIRLHFSYERFLENQIRAAFGFVGTPIWIKNRARGQKRGS
jgi:GTP-binding protein